MAINKKEMQDLLQLARLSIGTASQQQFNQDLTDILAMLDKLKEVNTDAVEPLTNPNDDRQRLRADVASEMDQRESLIKNAPASEAGLYLVPQVVDN